MHYNINEIDFNILLFPASAGTGGLNSRRRGLRNTLEDAQSAFLQPFYLSTCYLNNHC